jgi:hypothetical protein
MKAICLLRTTSLPRPSPFCPLPPRSHLSTSTLPIPAMTHPLRPALLRQTISLLLTLLPPPWPTLSLNPPDPDLPTKPSQHLANNPRISSLTSLPVPRLRAARQMESSRRGKCPPPLLSQSIRRTSTKGETMSKLLPYRVGEPPLRYKRRRRRSSRQRWRRGGRTPRRLERRKVSGSFCTARRRSSRCKDHCALLPLSR